MNITKYEKENYLLSEEKDFIILNKIKKLEGRKLNNQDKEIIKLIRTQLKEDWRSPLINYLNKF